MSRDWPWYGIKEALDGFNGIQTSKWTCFILFIDVHGWCAWWNGCNSQGLLIVSLFCHWAYPYTPKKRTPGIWRGGLVRIVLFRTDDFSWKTRFSSVFVRDVDLVLGKDGRKRIHPWRLTWNIIPWRFGRSFSFINGWFVGSSRSSSRV